MNAMRSRLDLLVENVHCAGCISKIERSVGALPGVAETRMNMSTRRLTTDFDPSVAAPETILDTVTSLGYPARPFRAQQATDAGETEERRLLLALAVAGFAAANVMLLSISVWAGAADMGPGTRALFHWISAMIALPAVVFAGRPFFVSAWRALRGGTMNMDVPISLAVILASAMSLIETLEGGEHAYFDAAVALLFFLLIGRYLDHRARTRARSAAARLLSMSGDSARVIDDGGAERTVALAEVFPGMSVAVAPGERVPVDGTVATGTSDVDTGLLTGESVPQAIAPGAAVYAGTINLTGPLVVRVRAAAGDTLLADIVRLMEAAEQGRSAYIKLVDRIARLYSPVVHILALATFLLWWGMLDGGLRESVLNAVAVLIITCPCALGLAVPVVRVVAHGLLFARGVLIKSADALERIAQTDVVVFDKTGTLTLGEPELIDDPADERVLAEAAALARTSRHPLSRALAAAAQGLNVPDVSGVREIAGSGLDGTIGGIGARLGRREWVAPEIEPDATFDGGELWFAKADGTRHRFRFRDRLKEDAREMVAALRALGLDLVIVSGDRTAAVVSVARELGIENWRAGCHPDDKVRIVGNMTADGRKVLMVGDGLNDAPALAAGFASLSPATAADVSRTVADAVFQGRALAPVVWLVRVARAAQGRVHENILFAIAYNAVAVPIAVAGLVTPLIAAVAMSSSSILVTLNSLRLKRTRL